MNKIQELEEKLNEAKNKYGLVGARRARVQEYDDAEHNLSAHIDPNNGWEIEVSVKTGYDPIQDSRQKAYARVKKIKDGLETVVLQVGSGHEVAHWELPFGSGKGCPFDTYNHDRIVEGIKNGLPENKKEHADYLANAFEDTIINPRVKEYFGDFSGQVLFWDGEGQKCEEKNGKKGFTPLYEAFVKVNLHLFGDKWDKLFMKRHYTNAPEVENAVKEAVSSMNLPEGIEDTTPFFRKEMWPKMAEAYAKAMAGLLDEGMPRERMSAYDSGSRGQGKPEEKPGNGIEEKVKTKEGKEGIAYGRYSHGDGLSPNMESFEQLDSLYQRLAKDIPVKVESVTRDSSMEISPLNYKQFDPEKDNPVKVKVSKFYFDGEGINFGYPNQPLTIDYRQKVQRKSFPNFKMVLVDNSGSMAEGIDGKPGRNDFIPWGDNSKYHYALLGYYGIENFLQNQGIAPYISHGVSVFSEKTDFKKGSYDNLVEMRKLLLNPRFGNDTLLDARELRKALEGEESFFLSISDGQISNWGSEKSGIKSLIDKNYYAHIQIGGRTQMTKDLESWGKTVRYVNSGSDLSKIMVDVAKDTYHPFVQEANKK